MGFILNMPHMAHSVRFSAGSARPIVETVVTHCLRPHADLKYTWRINVTDVACRLRHWLAEADQTSDLDMRGTRVIIINVRGTVLGGSDVRGIGLDGADVCH